MVRVSWKQDASVRTSLQNENFGPLVTPGKATQSKMRNKCCYGRGRTWVNIAVRPCLHSFLTYTTNITFSKIKCENLYKEVYSFVIEVVHYQLIMFPWIFVYDQLYYGYTTHPELLVMVGWSVRTKLLGCWQLRKKNSTSTINNHLSFDVQIAFNSTKEREREREREGERERENL